MSEIYRISVGIELKSNHQAILGGLHKLLMTVHQDVEKTESALNRMLKLSGAPGLGRLTNGFGGMAGHASALERSTAAIARNLASWEGRLTGAAREMRSAVAAAARGNPSHVHGSTTRRGRTLGYGGIVGAGVGVGVGYNTLESVVTQGASTVREGIREKNAGLTPAEIADLRLEAGRLSAMYPSLSKLDIRETGRLLIPNVGTYAQAKSLLPTYLAGQVALQSISGPDKAKEDMEYFSRYVDIIGRSTSEDATKTLIDGYIRARQLDPEAIKSNDFVNFAQRAAATGKGFSNDFLFGVVPALIAQQKGNSTGTDLNSAYQNTVIGRGTIESLKMQQASGLRSGLVTKGNRVISRGAYIEDALMQLNPFEWGKKYLIPKMVEQGYLPKGYLTGDYSQELTQEQRSGGAKFISQNFSNRRGANIFTMMFQDLDQISKFLERQKLTRGLSDILKDQANDPYIAWQALGKQITNLSSAISEPKVAELVNNLNRMTKGIGDAAEWLDKHPNRASGVFAAGAAGVGGLAAAGASALAIAAVTTLSLPALTIGTVAAVTIGSFLFPWAEFYKYMGWKPGIGLGGKDVDGKSLNPSDELPGIEKQSFLGNQIGASIQNAMVGASPSSGPMSEAVYAGVRRAFGELMGMGGGGASGGGSFGGAGIYKASLGGANDNGSFGGKALAVGGGSGIGHIASKAERAAYIRASAIRHGINPDVALRVAQSEGFNGYVGDQGRSFGDFQLFTGGGLGNIAERQGIRIRDPRTWKEQTDFAMKKAREQGWTPWHGAKKAGIGKWQGIGDMPARSAPTVGAPPARDHQIRVEVPLQLDGERVARSVTHHIVKKSRFPTSTGGVDSYGFWIPPGTTLNDVA